MKNNMGAGANPVAILGLFATWVSAGMAIWYFAMTKMAWPYFIIPAALVLIGAILPLAIVMANQWERAVVLRLGRLHSVRGPGIFVIIPLVDSIASWLDQRIQTTAFAAEEALSKDTVPVNIDAVAFWQVHDPERAALEITDYRQAIERVAQTSLRELIGASDLHLLLSDPHQSERLSAVIGRKTAEWGVSVISVEIRDISVPKALQDTMSRHAQAQAERQARILLGQAELEVAAKFVEAAEIYARSPTALQLRAMNIIYETTKERGATILMPTAMVDAMNPGGVLGLAGVAKAGS